MVHAGMVHAGFAYKRRDVLFSQAGAIHVNPQWLGKMYIYILCVFLGFTECSKPSRFVLLAGGGFRSMRRGDGSFCPGWKNTRSLQTSQTRTGRMTVPTEKSMVHHDAKDGIWYLYPIHSMYGRLH